MVFVLKCGRDVGNIVGGGKGGGRPGEKGAGGLREAGEEGGGKRDSQGGGKWENQSTNCLIINHLFENLIVILKLTNKRRKKNQDGSCLNKV